MQHAIHVQLQDGGHVSPAFGAIGDWRDTLAVYKSASWMVRYRPAHYGILVAHCHILPHEDQGMLFFSDVL